MNQIIKKLIVNMEMLTLDSLMLSTPISFSPPSQDALFSPAFLFSSFPAQVTILEFDSVSHSLPNVMPLDDNSEQICPFTVTSNGSPFIWAGLPRIVFCSFLAVLIWKLKVISEFLFIVRFLVGQQIIDRGPYDFLKHSGHFNDQQFFSICFHSSIFTVIWEIRFPELDDFPVHFWSNLFPELSFQARTCFWYLFLLQVWLF